MCQRPFLVLHDPDFVKQITIKDFDKFTDHFVSAYVRTACNVYAFETTFTQLRDKCMFHVMGLLCLTSQYSETSTPPSAIYCILSLRDSPLICILRIIPRCLFCHFVFMPSLLFYMQYILPYSILLEWNNPKPSAI